MVVAGWTLEYLFESVTGSLYEGASTSSGDGLRNVFAAKMDEYVGNDIRPLVFTFIMVGINIAVLLGGVQKGIEKLSNVLMPLLFIILVGLCCVTLSLPDAGSGVRFFL